MLWGVAQAQTIGYLRYDTVVVMKNGGNGELKIMNSTRGVTGGVLTNMGNGWGQWVTPAGTTPTWQQTLNATNGNILTQNNDIDTDGTDHDLRFGRNAIFGNITFAVGDNFEVSSAHTAITGTDSISLISAGLIHLRDSSVYGGSATNGYVWTLTDDTDGEGTWKPAAGGGLTVGTTTITSGTDTRVLFDDAGVLGEDAGLVFNKTTNALTVGGNIGTSGGNVTIGQPFPTASSVRFYHTDLANTSDWLLINKQNGQGIAFYNNDNSAYRMLLQDDGAFWLGGSAYPSLGGTIRGTSTGRVGINTDANASAALDVSSTTGGVLMPRMTSTQGSAITGVNGLVIYVTDTNGTFTSVGFWGYENGAWVKL